MDWRRRGGEGNSKKIILGSQNFGSQKLGKSHDFVIFGEEEVIVLSGFFRWNFFCRNPKVANFETFGYF